MDSNNNQDLMFSMQGSRYMEQEERMMKMNNMINKNPKFFAKEYLQQELMVQQYEQLTQDSVRLDKKFSFQEQANAHYSTQITTQSLNSKQSTMVDSSSLANNNSSSVPIFNPNILEKVKNLVKKFKDPLKFNKAHKMLLQWLSLSKEKRPDLKVVGISQLLGEGSQGKVHFELLSFDYSSKGILDLGSSIENYIPVALKYISDGDQFKREIMIIEQLQSKFQYQPQLVNIDYPNQTICMELCICTLEEFSFIPQNSLLMNDQFMASLLLRLMNRIVELMQTNIVHGDIKPQNTAFTLRNGQIDVILLDFGAASNNLSDYCNYYTKAYCHQKIIEMVYKNLLLDIDTVLYNELFCACRTIQYLLVNDKKSTLFYQTNYEEFKTKFHNTHPITVSILTMFFGNTSYSFSKQNFDSMMVYYNSIFKDSFNIDPKFLLNHSKIFSK